MLELHKIASLARTVHCQRPVRRATGGDEDLRRRAPSPPSGADRAGAATPRGARGSSAVELREHLARVDRRGGRRGAARSPKKNSRPSSGRGSCRRPCLAAPRCSSRGTCNCSASTMSDSSRRASTSTTASGFASDTLVAPPPHAQHAARERPRARRSRSAKSTSTSNQTCTACCCRSCSAAAWSRAPAAWSPPLRGAPVGSEPRAGSRSLDATLVDASRGRRPARSGARGFASPYRITVQTRRVWQPGREPAAVVEVHRRAQLGLRQS